MPNWQKMTAQQREEWQRLMRDREAGKNTGGRARRIVDAVKNNGNPFRKGR